MECEDGNLHLQLSAKLGHPDHVHFPATSPPFPHQSSCKRKSPSQQRRQERRRKEALSKADKAAPGEEVEASDPEKDTSGSLKDISEDVQVQKEAAKTPFKNDSKVHLKIPADELEGFKCDRCDHTASCKASLKNHTTREHKKQVKHERFKCNECNKNLDTKNCLNNHMITEHGHSGIVFSCDLCDFLTSRQTSLSIHLAKKHKEIEQVDGSNSEYEDNYAESYWERDYMGRNYKTYIDSLENIKTSNLSIEEKHTESERARRARMEAYLEDGWTVRDIERSIPF